jgi:hypothetical protein
MWKEINMAIREDGTVVFEGAEQQELDRIVGERLSREKAKYSDYDDLKGLDEELKAFGYEGTAKERREAIKAQREAIATQNELDELQEQAKEEGTSPELLKEIKELKKELAEIKGERQAKMAEKEAKLKADEAWNKQLEEFQEEYKDVDLDQLAENPKFKKFIKGKSLPLKELYEDFIDFVGETETDAIKKVMSKENRSTSGGKGTNTGGSYGLSDSQKKTVDEWNTKNPRMKMSYKEYAEKL